MWVLAQGILSTDKSGQTYGMWSAQGTTCFKRYDLLLVSVNKFQNGTIYRIFGSATALYIFVRYFRHKSCLLATIDPYAVRSFFSTCLTSSRRVSLRLQPMGRPRYTTLDETVIDSLPSRRCLGWEGISLKKRTADLEVLKARPIFRYSSRRIVILFDSVCISCISILTGLL